MIMKKEKILNKEVKDLIIGCLLGDAHIGLVKPNIAYITFEQSIDKSPYVLHLYDVLLKNNIDLHNIKYYTRQDNRYNSTNTSIYFKTLNLELLYPFYLLFVNEKGTKIIPDNIKDYLNYRVLAYWISDDGQLVKKGGITLCTDNYTYKEVKHLLTQLEIVFNINCSIHIKKSKYKEYYRIYIKKSSLDKLKPKIVKYIHPYFLYKIHM